jgi:hypothetical protein
MQDNLIISRECYSRGCAAYDDRVDAPGVCVKDANSNHRNADNSMRAFMQNKPVVYYVTIDSTNIQIGKSANVIALDHPMLGKEYVITSTVIAITEDGFETRNTIYKLKK